MYVLEEDGLRLSVVVVYSTPIVLVNCNVVQVTMDRKMETLMGDCLQVVDTVDTSRDADVEMDKLREAIMVARKDQKELAE